MKIFLSHNMHGLEESDVIRIRDKATKLLCKKYGDDIEIIDNYHHNDVPENAGRLWHLGTSIRQLEEADAIYFCDNANSNGCLVELFIAKLYHIPIINIDQMIKYIEPSDLNNKDITLLAEKMNQLYQ